MTVLGKILAILNLVLSLAVGAFLVMTYVARTNWHAAYVNMQKQAQVAQADADAFKKEMEKVKGDKAKGEEQLADYRKRTDEEKLALNARIEALGNKLKDAGQEIAKHVAAQSAAGDELKRRASEVDYLKTLVTARDVDSVRSQLGLRFTKEYELHEKYMLAPDIRLRWEHEFKDDNGPITAAFVGAPGIPFTSNADVSGLPTPSEQLLLTPTDRSLLR